MAQEPLKNLLPQFIKDLEDKGRSPSTILAYRADIEQLLDFLHGRNKVLPEQVLASDIEAFRDSLLSEKYTPKTVSRKLNAIKTFFRYLISEKKASADPSDPVSHPKIEPSVPKFLSPLEYRALRDVVRDDARIAAIVELILQTGLRISEVANLKLENLKDGKLTVEAYATQPERTVPLNKSAKEAVERYTKEERPESDSEYVFISKNGNPLAVRNIRAAIDRYMQNLKAGVDLVLLSQIVGHKRLSTTERYLELAEVKDPGKKQELKEL